MRINEIYYTLQGESVYAGLPSVMVRTAYCPVGCIWCDTCLPSHHHTLSIGQILDELTRFNCTTVTLTGGEPLEEEDIFELENALLKLGFTVILETSGLYSLDRVSKGTHVVMDIKCPDSRVQPSFLETNLTFLKPSDEIKFVIHTERDVAFAITCIHKHRLSSLCKLAFSITHHATISSSDLANAILKSHLPVRFQPPLHATFWKDERRFQQADLSRYPIEERKHPIDIGHSVMLS